MEVEFTHEDLLVYHKILRKLRKASDPEIQWEISGRRLEVERLKAPVDEAIDPPERIKAYTRERSRYLERNGVPESSLKLPDGSSLINYKTDDQTRFDLARIREEYSEDLNKEESRLEKQEEFLKKKTTVVLEPLKFEWLSENTGVIIDGDDMTFLRRFSLVLPPERPKDIDKGRKSKRR
jgi:hypothetical protein